jgi:hypothetical protein
MKADAQGFLIADRAISVDSLASAMKGVKGDTAAILAMLKVGARASTAARARVLNSGANRGPSAGVMGERMPSMGRDETGKSLARVAAALARERDERGRFKPYPTAELTEVAKAVRDMTRRQAAEHEQEKRERAKRTSKGADSAQSGPDSSAQSASGKPPRGPQSGSATPLQAGTNGAAAEAARDSRGRFTAKGGMGGDAEGSSNAGGGRAKRERDGEGVLGKMKDWFKGFGGIKGPNMPGVEGFEKVDPTVEASRELGGMIKAPLAAVGTVGKAVVGRGFSAASKLPAAPWYRRILKELHLFRGESSTFGLAETRVLKDIERKTGGGSSGAKGGLLGMLGGGAAGLLGKGGGLLMSLLGGGLKLGGGLLKRLPILGALLAGGSALASIFGPDDPNKTPEQNRTDRFTGAGSGIGAIIGGGLGMFLGPVGALIGGVIGDKVGELVGAWLATVDWSKVGAQITGAWDGTVSWVKDEWKVVTDKLAGITKTVSDTWTSITTAIKSFLKDKFGVDIDALAAKAAQVAKPVTDKAKEIGGKVADGAKSAASAVGNYLSDRGQKMVAPLARAGGSIMDWGESIYSKLDKGYRRKQSFDGIKGGDGLAKYGSYTDDEAARIRELKQSGANTSANLKGGMPADVRDKIVAASLKNGLDPKTMLEFASMESGGNANAISSTGAVGIFQFTGATASGVGIKDRFNVDQNIQGGMQLANSNAAQLKKAGLPVNAANLYMMHQLGPGAAKEIIQGAKDGKSISQLSGATQQAVSLNYGAGSKTAADYLAKNSAALTDRGQKVVGDMSNLGPMPTPTVAAAAAPPPPPVPPAPVAPPPAPPTVAADIPQPLNTPGPIDVRVSQDTTVGQDLSDRRLAQIATGGISA